MQCPGLSSVLVLVYVLCTLYASADSRYVLQEDYPLEIFFNKFDFFSCGVSERPCDPTDGFVQYVDHASANLAGLISTTPTSVIIRTDDTTVLDPSLPAPGRKSVRIESKNSYNHGLVIADIKHMPGGVCGTWPALWMLGSNGVWPSKGEIDILEGVNETPNSVNIMTLHTSANCSAVGKSCEGNNGCGVQSNQLDSFGRGFNAQDGGVYATEWTPSFIKIWFFPRIAIPQDIKSGFPDPSGWANPSAQFQASSSCDFEQHFQDLRIIINLTFCGGWAGEPHNYASCRASTNKECIDFVATSPSSFSDMFWEIYSLKVYNQADNSAPPPPHGVQLERQELR